MRIFLSFNIFMLDLNKSDLIKLMSASFVYVLCQLDLFGNGEGECCLELWTGGTKNAE